MTPWKMDSTRLESLTTVQRVFYFVLPALVIVGALIVYKSSAALTVIEKVSATGVFTPAVTLFRGLVLLKPVS